MTMVKTTCAALILAFVVGSAGPVAAQSFSCNGPLKPDEAEVCDSGRLAGLDDEMAALYGDIRAHALMGVRGDVIDSQRQFLDDRAACGADDGCIKRLYKERIAELKLIKDGIGQGGAAQ